MFSKDKLLLTLSAITLLATIVAAITTTPEIALLGTQIQILWLPIFVIIVFLPFLNVIEIAKNVDDYAVYNWIGLLLNIITMIFILKSFKLELF